MSLQRSHVYDTSFASPNGKMPEAVPQESAQSEESFFRRIFRWEKLVVGGREVKGFVVTPAIAATIVGVVLTAFLGAIGWAYTSNTKESRDTHDAVIRMETMLNERTQRFNDEQAEFKSELKEEKGLAQLQRENQEKRLWQMEQAIKQRGRG